MNLRTLKVGTDVPNGNVITTDLKDKKILGVFVGGAWVEDENITGMSGYKYNPNLGDFDFSSIGGIENVILNIQYATN